MRPGRNAAAAILLYTQAICCRQAAAYIVPGQHAAVAPSLAKLGLTRRSLPT